MTTHASVLQAAMAATQLTPSLGPKCQASEASQADIATLGCPSPTQQLSSCSRRDGQQSRLVSPFAPFAAHPPPSPPHANSTGAGQSTTLDKLAHLLLGIPQASGQLAEMMSAIQAGREEATLHPAHVAAASRKRPLGLAAAEDPSRAAALNKLAHLLLEVPNLSGSLAKSMASIMESQGSEEPPAKRSKLRATTVARCTSVPLAAALPLAPTPRGKSAVASVPAPPTTPAATADAIPTLQLAASSSMPCSAPKEGWLCVAPRLAGAPSAPAPASSGLAAARSAETLARMALVQSYLKAHAQLEQQRRRQVQLVLMRHWQRQQQQRPQMAAN